MNKNYILKWYILHLEKIFSGRNAKKINYTWKKIKNDEALLNYIIEVNNNKFNSNLIVSLILTDKTFFGTEIYNKIITIIYKNSKLARIKLNETATFLLLTLENENLILDDTKKAFLVDEAGTSPYTEKYYKENLKNTVSYHGLGIFDIRYKILLNNNFSLNEKKKLYCLFYTDDEVKITILNEIKWIIAKKLGLEKNENLDKIYYANHDTLNQSEIELLELCKYIESIVPEDSMQKFLTNS